MGDKDRCICYVHTDAARPPIHTQTHTTTHTHTHTHTHTRMRTHTHHHRGNESLLHSSALTTAESWHFLMPPIYLPKFRQEGNFSYFFLSCRPLLNSDADQITKQLHSFLCCVKRKPTTTNCLFPTRLPTSELNLSHCKTRDLTVKGASQRSSTNFDLFSQGNNAALTPVPGDVKRKKCREPTDLYCLVKHIHIVSVLETLHQRVRHGTSCGRLFRPRKEQSAHHYQTQSWLSACPLYLRNRSIKARVEVTNYSYSDYCN